MLAVLDHQLHCIYVGNRVDLAQSTPDTIKSLAFRYFVRIWLDRPLSAAQFFVIALLQFFSHRCNNQVLLPWITTVKQTTFVERFEQGLQKATLQHYKRMTMSELCRLCQAFVESWSNEMLRHCCRLIFALDEHALSSSKVTHTFKHQGNLLFNKSRVRRFVLRPVNHVKNSVKMVQASLRTNTFWRIFIWIVEPLELCRPGWFPVLLHHVALNVTWLLAEYIHQHFIPSLTQERRRCVGTLDILLESLGTSWQLVLVALIRVRPSCLSVNPLHMIPVRLAVDRYKRHVFEMFSRWVITVIFLHLSINCTNVEARIRQVTSVIRMNGNVFKDIDWLVRS